MKRELMCLWLGVFIATCVGRASAELVDLTVDSARSSVTIQLLGDSDNSSISGSAQIDLLPPAEPFGTAQMTAMDLVLDDGFFLSVFGGLVTISADPGAVSMELVSPGPPGNVDPQNNFQQLGNIAALLGLIDVFDPLNLFVGTGTYDLADFGDAPFDITDANLAVNGQTLTVTINFIVEQEVSPGVLLTVTGTVVAVGTLPPPVVIVTAETVDVVLGTNTEGELADTNESDDIRFCFFRGNPFAVTQPSIWLDFESTLPTDSPSSMTLIVEAQADSNDIDQRIWAFNFDNSQWELLDTTEIGFNNDTVVSVDVTGDVDRFVEMGTGTVRMRVTYTQGPTSLFLAWSACLDQVVWQITD